MALRTFPLIRLVSTLHVHILINAEITTELKVYIFEDQSQIALLMSDVEDI